MGKAQAQALGKGGQALPVALAHRADLVGVKTQVHLAFSFRFGNKIPVYMVEIHPARDARQAARAGILVDIPGDGGIVIVPVIGQPDAVAGGPDGCQIHPGKPGGIAVVAGAVEAVSPDIVQKGQGAGGAASRRDAVFLLIEVKGQLQLPPGQHLQAGPGLLLGVGGVFGVAEPVGPHRQADGAGPGIVFLKILVLLAHLSAVAGPQDEGVEPGRFKGGPVDTALMGRDIRRKGAKSHSISPFLFPGAYPFQKTTAPAFTPLPDWIKMCCPTEKLQEPRTVLVLPFTRQSKAEPPEGPLWAQSRMSMAFIAVSSC